MPPATPTCNFQCTGKECFLKGPAAPNVGKRMLVGSDGRPDVAVPTPGEFEKRFLQKLSGLDQAAAQYVDKDGKAIDTAKVGEQTALDIPTRAISTNQYYLPGIKIDNVLKRAIEDLVKDSSTGLRRMLAGDSVISGEISNGKATLSTGLDNHTKNLYEFTVKDKLR